MIARRIASGNVGNAAATRDSRASSARADVQRMQDLLPPKKATP
jgi:hypothetical protein